MTTAPGAPNTFVPMQKNPGSDREISFFYSTAGNTFQAHHLIPNALFVDPELDDFLDTLRDYGLGPTSFSQNGICLQPMLRMLSVWVSRSIITSMARTKLIQIWQTSF